MTPLPPGQCDPELEELAGAVRSVMRQREANQGRPDYVRTLQHGIMEVCKVGVGPRGVPYVGQPMAYWWYVAVTGTGRQVAEEGPARIWREP